MQSSLYNDKNNWAGGGGGSMFSSLVLKVYTMIKTIDLKVSENHGSAVLDGGIVILKCIG